MRRFVSCTLASLIGVGVLMIAPASSLAGGGFVPCTSSLCPSSTQLMVEVMRVRRTCWRSDKMKVVPWG